MGQSLVEKNLQHVRHEIDAVKKQSGCPDRQIDLIAVSKRQSSESILVAFNAGQTQFAENYCQEAVAKIKQLKDKAIVWHFIGAIQTNKIKLITEYFLWVQSISRLKEIKSFDAAAKIKKIKLNLCVQINIDNDPNKSGVKTEVELKTLLAEIKNHPNLTARGLMILPTKHESEKEQKDSFDKAFLLFQKMQNEGFDLDVLSMGMSADLPSAIAAGSNMVRVGTAIFGERQ